ncbi:MAG: CHRD domain-containing protein [Chitinophagaceae bacterium]
MKKKIFPIALIATSFAIFSCSKAHNELEAAPEITSGANSLSKNDDQLNVSRIVFTQVVQLEGSQEVPAVQTETKGIAILRVTADKKLYSKVIIQKLAEGDVLRFAHIHAGAAGANGPVRINLASSAADFGENKEFQLSDALYTLISTGAAYVNAHSNFFPGGIVRGQIR